MRYSLLSLSSLWLACAGFALAACTGPVIMGADAAAIAATKPGEPPPADTALQIPPHESWCYASMGDPVCYAHPQDVPPDRLINVDPPSRYPVDLPAYHDAVAGRPVAATAAPAMLEPGAAAQAEQQKLKDEIDSAPLPPATSAP